MSRLNPRVRIAALGLKTVSMAVGLVAVGVSLGLAYDELSYLAGTGSFGLGDVVDVLAIVALGLAGTALVAQLPESLRARFRRVPSVGVRRPVYGFGTMVAVGIGATLGSPLFFLIPLNIEQYEVISLASLLLATVLSVAMAKLYSDLGKESKVLGGDLVGGPSFAKVASGARSVRYFVSRVSMWVANTALAAYTKIVFIIFDFVFMPQLLAAYGLSPSATSVVIYTIAGAFIAWTVLNILFEQRYLRAMGAIQIALTTLLLLILVYHSAVLGNAGGWNLSGFLTLPSGGGWISVLIINTGYLYLLFFGFQEIQVLERDSMERSSIPVLSWIRKGYALGRNAYFGVAMVVSVVIAAAINIVYGIAVFASAHSLPSLQAACSVNSCIPALYIAKNILGPGQELLLGVAFLLATITTFVPAFLAAARHLAALGEDGYMPPSLARLSWVFTLVAVFLLAIGDQNFLVNITDVMVLFSLGIIALTGVWVGRRTGGRMVSGGLSLGVGMGCFLFGGALYFSPGGGSVVVFGAVAVIFAYLIFDIIELGTLGAQLFFSVFGLVCVATLAVFGNHVSVGGTVGLLVRGDPNYALGTGLLAASILLMVNVILDVKVLGRTAVK